MTAPAADLSNSLYASLNVIQPSAPEVVTKPDELARVCERLAAAGSFAFDTEFVGEDHFAPEVCLLQAATDSFCVLIDPMDGLDLTPIWSLIADDRIQIILHAGSEDLMLCWRAIGKQPANIFDLQVAAGFIGLGYPISLLRLARQTLHRKIHKSQTLTDWRKRPLTDEQIRYAIEDVIHLPAIHREIASKLAAAKRTAWACEEFDHLCRPEVFDPDPVLKLRRLKGAGSLRPKELAIADALLEEREALALEYDRPPRAVLKDHLLVEMARRGWTDVRRLRSLRGVNLSTKALARIAERIQQAAESPEESWPEMPGDEDSAEEDVLITLVSAVLRDFCQANSIAYGLLANKQDLRTLVRGYTRPAEKKIKPAILTGWRLKAAGDLIDGLLSGKAAIRIEATGKGHRLRVK